MFHTIYIYGFSQTFVFVQYFISLWDDEGFKISLIKI